MAEYYGDLAIYGSTKTREIINEAHNRLRLISGISNRFEINAIKSVFFGSIDVDTEGKLGCRGLLLDEIREETGKNNLQIRIFFTTLGGYPDYFAQYIVDQISKVDPTSYIRLACVGDGIHKIRMAFYPTIKTPPPGVNSVALSEQPKT
jgi:hypothetical protein